MKTESVLDNLAQLIDTFEQGNTLFPDKILRNHCAKNRWLGSKDRYALRELFFSWLRFRILVLSIIENIEVVDSRRQALIVLWLCTNNPLVRDLKSYGGVWTDKKLQRYFERYISNEQLTEITKQLLEPNQANVDKLLAQLKQLHILSVFNKALTDDIPTPWKKNMEIISHKDFLSLFSRATLDIRPNYLNLPYEKAQSIILDLLADQLENVPYLESSIFNDSIRLTGSPDLSKTSLYQGGSIEVMAEGSRAIVSFLAPKDGDNILDACAGAGGKSLEICSLTSNKSITSLYDADINKLEEAQRRALLAGAEVNLLEKQPSSLFDKVLVDVPCSGSGRIRRQPELFSTITQPMLEELAREQLRILNTYSMNVKVGGLLIYATCSLFRIENQDVIDKFLSTNTNFELTTDRGFLEEAIFQQDSRFLQITPWQHNTDGFFAAKLKRIA